MADDIGTRLLRFKRWKNMVGRAFGLSSNRVSDLQAQEHPGALPSASATSHALDVPIHYSTQPTSSRVSDLQARLTPNLGTSSEHMGWESTARSMYSVRTGASVFGFERRNLIKSLFHVWDNRLAMKLFGSKWGIKKEEERLENCPYWVIHPCSKFR